jgi:DNA-binding transcriptional ArsR family regulator
MIDIPDIYPLESIEQVKAIADELRQRIIHALARQQMTVTQLGDLLDQAPAKLHYHVRELERLGLVVLVETREKGGILEKYYRTRGRTLTIPATLYQERPPDETIGAAFDFIQDVAQGFMESFSRTAMGHMPLNGATTLSRWHLWMTEGEVATLNRKVAALVEPYEQPRGIEGEQELSFVEMLYNPRLLDGEDDDSAIRVENEDEDLNDFFSSGKGVRVSHGAGKRLRTWSVGVTSFSRKDLERAVKRGNALDIVTFGHVTFKDDVSPDLADRAVFRFRHRGTMSAPPAVREVLMRKGEESSTDGSSPT